MTSSFSGSVLTPATGIKPTSLVVLMHGYGSSGDDLIGLAEVWQKQLPSTVFVAPNGPSICDQYAEGYQWFSLSEWDFHRMKAEVEKGTPAFNAYIDALMETYNIPAEKVAFVGFSQGAMMALHMTLVRPSAGAVAYSGAFMGQPKDFCATKAPVLLLHGAEDTRVPPSFSEDAERQLKALGVSVALELLPQLDHSINLQGMSLGGTFLKEVLQ